ncbi:MAG: hypothetical protein WA093_04895 [Minisyncoccales bacterium]
MKISKTNSIKLDGVVPSNGKTRECLICARKLPVGYPVRVCGDCLEMGLRGSICLVATAEYGKIAGFVLGFEIVTDENGKIINLFADNYFGDFIGMPESNNILRDKIFFFVDDLATVEENGTNAEKELVAKLIWPHGRRNILIKMIAGSRLFETCKSLGGKKIFEQNKICLQIIEASK